MISDERVERAARAMCDDMKGGGYYDHERTDDAKREGWRMAARAALEADATAITAAKLEELQTVKKIIEGFEAWYHGDDRDDYSNDHRNTAKDIREAIDARISALQAESVEIHQAKEKQL